MHVCSWTDHVQLFEELNIPRKLTIIPIAIGGASWSMAVQGSTQVQNVIPTGLGTTLMAAPLLSFIMAIAGLAISIIYTEHVYKKEMALVAAGKEEGWDKTGRAL